MTMPRLLYVVNVDWFFVSHRLPLALAAKKAGFEVHVATTVTEHIEEIERHGVTVHSLDMDRRSANPFTALKIMASLVNLMRELKPSVVHLVTIKPVLLGGIAARLARVPRVIAAISGLGYVFTAQGRGAQLRRSIVGHLYRLSLGPANVRVVFQNTNDLTLLRRYTGLHDEKTVVIRGSGVELGEWPMVPLPRGLPIVMMASRLLWDKGVSEFVEAARILSPQKHARFVLVGDLDTGNPASISEGDLVGWIKTGVIEHWGYCTDMHSVLAQSHIVVLPSYREGLPKILIEAAACGRPVITTNVPGCRDAIEPGKTGVLVPVRDIYALADAIAKMLEEPARMEAMGLAGRKLAESAFDVREVADRHIALYENRAFNK